FCSPIKASSVGSSPSVPVLSSAMSPASFEFVGSSRNMAVVDAYDNSQAFRHGRRSDQTRRRGERRAKICQRRSTQIVSSRQPNLGGATLRRCFYILCYRD